MARFRDFRLEISPTSCSRFLRVPTRGPSTRRLKFIFPPPLVSPVVVCTFVFKPSAIIESISINICLSRGGGDGANSDRAVIVSAAGPPVRVCDTQLTQPPAPGVRLFFHANVIVAAWRVLTYCKNGLFFCLVTSHRGISVGRGAQLDIFCNS